MRPSHRTDRGPSIGWAAVGLFVIACGVLGGLLLGQRLVIVSGTSMLPTAETGDLVVIWPTAEYEIGRLLMEAKALEFGEGTSDLHQKMVAEFALGLRKQ